MRKKKTKNGGLPIGDQSTSEPHTSRTDMFLCWRLKENLNIFRQVITSLQSSLSPPTFFSFTLLSPPTFFSCFSPAPFALFVSHINKHSNDLPQSDLWLVEVVPGTSSTRAFDVMVFFRYSKKIKWKKLLQEWIPAAPVMNMRRHWNTSWSVFKWVSHSQKHTNWERDLFASMSANRWRTLDTNLQWTKNKESEKRKELDNSNGAAK